MESLILIDVTFNETRVAVIENGTLAELYVERKSQPRTVGNIYKGRVLRVLPGMQAAFVEIGLDKAAFLYVDDVLSPEGEPREHEHAFVRGFHAVHFGEELRKIPTVARIDKLRGYLASLAPRANLRRQFLAIDLNPPIQRFQAVHQRITLLDPQRSHQPNLKAKSPWPASNSALIQAIRRPLPRLACWSSYLGGWPRGPIRWLSGACINPWSKILT